MAVITKIEAQKRKEDRVNIYVDEKFFMAIYKELVFTFNLKKGDNIDEEYLNKILSYIGKNTMGIFYLHILVIQLLMKIDIVQRGTLVNTLKTIIVVFISAIITTLLKKIPVIKKLVQ